MKIASADKREGHLIWSGDSYYIRFYDPADRDRFKDYRIAHTDLCFRIDDEDAYLYENGKEMWIDHSPETLCLELKADDEEDAMINAFDEYLQSIREPIDPSRPKAIPHSDAEWEAWRHAWKKAKE